MLELLIVDLKVFTHNHNTASYEGSPKGDFRFFEVFSLEKLVKRPIIVGLLDLSKR